MFWQCQGLGNPTRWSVFSFQSASQPLPLVGESWQRRPKFVLTSNQWLVNTHTFATYQLFNSKKYNSPSKCGCTVILWTILSNLSTWVSWKICSVFITNVCAVHYIGMLSGMFIGKWFWAQSEIWSLISQQQKHHSWMFTPRF